MLTIKIKTDNDAFQDGNRFDEISKCLDSVLYHLSCDRKEGNIHDTNGNVTGTFKLTNR